MERVAVRVVARDVIGAAGLTMVLLDHPDIVEAMPGEPADVILCSIGRVDDPRRLRQLPGRIVVLANGVGEYLRPTDGVVAVVDRARTTPVELVDTVLAAARGPVVQPSRRGADEPAWLSDREIEVLRLLADGADTWEIARRLTYSESTIKYVLHNLTSRLKLRNRVHAVAFALRSGLL